MSQKYITGLDIGSNNIKVVVGELKKDGRLAVIRAMKFPSAGMRRGTIDDLAAMTRSLNQVFGELRQISKDVLKNIFLNIGGHDINIQSSRGMVAVSRSDYEIHQEDIDRALQGAQAVNLKGNNRMVVHSITKEFVVDGVGNIANPLGMIGNRLEVHSLIVDAFGPNVKNLTKCVEMAGANIGGLIFGPFAASRSVLSKNQKDLGVAVIDIGANTTSLCVYDENKLLHTAVFPVGSGNITNDLAIGLRTSPEAAETVKLSFGSAVARGTSGRESIDLKKIDPAAKGPVTRKFIAEIIESRLAEIFEFVNNELKLVSRAGQLPAGIVLVGGGSKLPGIVELAKDELKLPAQIGIPETSSVEIASGELNLQVEDPGFAGAMGLLEWGFDRTGGGRESASSFWKRLINYLVP
ncbi:MAG: cell division protein FtsA [bacterium]|nr:cell division protein FtsA [bacterium]